MRWKSILLASLCLFQGAEAMEDTWLRTDYPENSSYLSPKLKATTVDDSLVYWPGLGVGWIVGSVIAVGFWIGAVIAGRKIVSIEV